MVVPKGFQFSENPSVHRFAEDRATLMFGKDWKNRDDLKLSRPFPEWVCLDNKKDGWALLVKGPIELRYTISCEKNGVWEDPAPNVAGLCGFSSKGCLEFQGHYSSDLSINPPDGTPSYINYRAAGGVIDGWYVDDTGTTNSSPATPVEIAKRVSEAKHTSAAELCDGSQDIIALKLVRYINPSLPSPNTSPSIVRA